MTGREAGFVQLFGAARARVGLRWAPFAPDKRHQLLAYLAYSGDWVSREKFAYLFWPDTTTQKAQQNLRGLLHRLRSLGWLSGLEVEAQRLRWPVETDVRLFRQALEHGNLDEALSLYSGPLLEKLEGDEALEFSSWLEIEREHLHARWREALLKRAQELQEVGELRRAVTLLGALLERDPLDEEALAAYLHAASRAGKREQALRIYQNFSNTLHEELGLKPTSTTQRLAQAIQDGESEVQLSPPPARASTLNPTSFPTPVTSFVGRELELSEIAHLLLKPECRLLTLTGPGGIGKTRIALQAVQELAEHYQNGVSFVSLDSLTSPQFIPSAMAEALGLQLQGHEEPFQQVMCAIGKKRMLLVLDNFEHLLEGADLASRLVQACPNLKLLVTSRERLDLSEEWLLPLEGLPLSTKGMPNSKEALASDAAILFIQRARQVQPNFTPTNEDLTHTATICQLVQGSPLAIELAAVWVRMMRCAEVAREIESNLDILSTSTRNVSERHKSLRATFEHSWKLLTSKEQEVLRKLSVFKGGFRKEAAAVVTGASIAVLAALVDKSLLRITSAGRYAYHSLLHQYAAEKLAEHPNEEAQLQARHGSYFLALAEETRTKLRSVKDADPLNRLEQEHENLRAALNWALKEVPGVTALRLTAALGQFWEIRGHLSEGRRWLEAALAQQDAPTAARARALSALGRLTLLQSGASQAAPLLEAGLELWRRLGDKTGTADALNHLGIIALGQHDYERAEALYRESLALYREIGDEEGVAILLNNFGELARCQRDYARARSFYEGNYSAISNRHCCGV